MSNMMKRYRFLLPPRKKMLQRQGLKVTLQVSFSPPDHFGDMCVGKRRVGVWSESLPDFTNFLDDICVVDVIVDICPPPSSHSPCRDPKPTS